MTDITKLPDKWRENERLADDSDTKFCDYLDGYACADELQAALPVWTKFTGEPDTWPETEKGFLACEPNGDGGWYGSVYEVVRQWTDNLIAEYDGLGWRYPVPGIDSPPENEND